MYLILFLILFLVLIAFSHNCLLVMKACSYSVSRYHYCFKFIFSLLECNMFGGPLIAGGLVMVLYMDLARPSTCIVPHMVPGAHMWLPYMV